MSADVLEMISRIKVTKYEATHVKAGEDELQRILHQQENIPPSKFREQVDNFRAHQVNKIVVPLYPPGSIVHLFKVKEEEPTRCCARRTHNKTESRQSEFAARWTERSDLAEILISPHFLDDHSSPNVLAALERVAGFFDLVAPFTMDEPVE